MLVEKAQIEDFIKALAEKASKCDSIADPTDWCGGVESSCYITPKEVCCFPWKTVFTSPNMDVFSEFNIACAVDSCCSYTLKHGENRYRLPAFPIRRAFNISNTDGYSYIDEKHHVIAEYTTVGEKWGTYQEMLVIGKKMLIEKLDSDGMQLVWIMREFRRHTGLAIEKFGDFGVDRCKSYVGYYRDSSFVTREIRSHVQSDTP